MINSTNATRKLTYGVGQMSKRRHPPRWCSWTLAVIDDMKQHVPQSVLDFVARAKANGVTMTNKQLMEYVDRNHDDFGYNSLKPPKREVAVFIINSLNSKWRCCWPSARTIASKLELHPDTVRKVLKGFEEKGLIRIVTPNGAASRSKRFIYPTKRLAPNCHAFWDYRGVDEAIPTKHLPRKQSKKNMQSDLRRRSVDSSVQSSFMNDVDVDVHHKKVDTRARARVRKQVPSTKHVMTEEERWQWQLDNRARL